MSSDVFGEWITTEYVLNVDYFDIASVVARVSMYCRSDRRMPMSTVLCFPFAIQNLRDRVEVL